MNSIFQSNVILGVHEKACLVEINGKMFCSLISVRSILSIGVLDSKLTEEYSWLEVSFWMTKTCFPSVVNHMDVANIKIYISPGVTSCDCYSLPHGKA